MPLHRCIVQTNTRRSDERARSHLRQDNLQSWRDWRRMLLDRRLHCALHDRSLCQRIWCFLHWISEEVELVSYLMETCCSAVLLITLTILWLLSYHRRVDRLLFFSIVRGWGRVEVEEVEEETSRCLSRWGSYTKGSNAVGSNCRKQRCRKQHLRNVTIGSNIRGIKGSNIGGSI